MGVKKHSKKAVISSLSLVKRVVRKNPLLKNVVKDFIRDNVNLHALNPEFSQYQTWIQNNYPDAIRLLEAAKEIEKFTYKPKISILTPTYNTNLEHLYECIKSVQSQVYDNWEMCIIDDASSSNEGKDVIKRMAAEDSRIKYAFRDLNGHISKASNDALDMAQGEFISMLDHDDILWPNALFEVVKALNKDQQLDFIYSDQEKVYHNRSDHQDPFFKPDWNPEFLESVNFITHFNVIRKDLVDKIGGFRSKYDGAQDWDLFLRTAYASDRIHHIPTILYSWRMAETSTALNTEAKPYVREAQKSAIKDSLTARGFPEAEVKTGVLKDYWTVVYPVIGNPKVSIVIPSKNQQAIVKKCINSVLRLTSYKNYEIILVDTGSDNREVLRWYKKLAKSHPHIKILNWPEQPFSYARACNHGVSKASGDYIVFLNNDTEVKTPDWLELLLSDAQRDDIGAVGCKLLYPDGRLIQHAGVGIGLGGLAANLLSQVPDKNMSPMQNLYANTRHEVSAVTAACMMVKKDKLDSVDGFDEKFRITYNDVDLCLRLIKKGYRNIYNPSIVLVHHESISVGLPKEIKKRSTKEFQDAQKLFKQRWKSYIDYDPQLNPNISRDNAYLDIKTSSTFN